VLTGLVARVDRKIARGSFGSVGDLEEIRAFHGGGAD
jgi:hypothetical protein